MVRVRFSREGRKKKEGKKGRREKGGKEGTGLTARHGRRFHRVRWNHNSATWQVRIYVPLIFTSRLLHCLFRIFGPKQGGC